MHTTPADAGELAATIAARTRVDGPVERVICPPFVCLAAVRDALAGTGVAVGAQNVHHELTGAYTGEVERADARRPRDVGDRRPLRAATRRRRDRRAHRPQAPPGGRGGPAPDRVRRRAARRARGRPGRGGRPRAGPRGPRGLRRRHDRRRRGGPDRERRRDRLRAGLGDRHRPQRDAGPTPRRWPTSIRAAIAEPGLADLAAASPGALRRERDRGEHRRVPGRAGDRRGARRRGLAQARRDGRDRGPGRPDGGRPAGGEE